MPPLTVVGLFGVGIVVGVLCAIIAFLGFLLARPPVRKRLIGGAPLRRLLAEAGVLNFCAQFIPFALFWLLLKANLPSAQLLLFGGVALTASLLLVVLVLPLYVAARLAVPTDSEPRARAGYFGRAIVGLIVVIGLTSFFGYAVFPARLLAQEGQSGDMLAELAGVSLATTFAAVAMCVMLRGAAELLRFASVRPYEPTSETSLAPRWAGSVLRLLLSSTLAVWALAYVLYHNYERFPGAVLLRSLDPTGLLPVELLPVVARTPVFVWLSGILSVLVLSLGLLAVRARPQEPVVLLFGWLCLLHGWWGLELFPRVGGDLLLTLHHLAMVLVAPVQLHFALLFPHAATTMAPGVRPGVRWALWALYSLYVVPALGNVILMSQGLGSIFVLMEQRPVLAPLIGFQAACASLAGPLSAALGGLILWQTWDRLGEAQVRAPAAASVCAWQALVTPSPLTAGAIARQRQQLKYLAQGTCFAAVLFIIWLALVVPGLVPFAADWGNVAGKAALACVFLAITFALMRQQLWGIRRAVLGPVLLALFPVVSYILNLIAEPLDDLIAPYLGLLSGVVLFGILLVSDRQLQRLYPYLRPSHWQWQEHLRRLYPRGGPPALRALLEEARPPDASAAWLLEPPQGPSGRPMSSLGHKACCTLQCTTKLASMLRTPGSGAALCLSPDLEQLVAETLMERADPVIVVRALAHPRPRWARWWPFWPRAALCPATVEQLYQARIALVVVFGEPGEAAWLYLIASDGGGDYYDQHDIEALRDLAERLCYLVAPPRKEC